MCPETELDMQTQLHRTQREAAYYRKLAQDCGERRLKESEDLSRLIDQLRQTERELAQARDELEQRVAERTTELAATNDRLLQEIQERQQIADELAQAHTDLQQSHGELEHERAMLEIRVQQRTEEIMQMQQERVRELAAPLIPLFEQVLLMPWIGTIDPERAAQMQATLLRGVQTHRATLVLLDLTGVHVIDPPAIPVLLQVVQATRLLGAQIILTGIPPRIAEGLIQLDTDRRGIVSRATLQAGLTEVLQRTHPAYSSRRNGR
ncbi:MAG: STAS domain-containing protein [Chloroflexaceae bacterium]|nr:STAS domain-containing protein [Chloroflexaceae bacterium]